MSGITLDQIIESLSLLRFQLNERGTNPGEIDELIFLPDRIKMKRGALTLTVPIKQVSMVR